MSNICRVSRNLSLSLSRASETPIVKPENSAGSRVGRVRVGVRAWEVLHVIRSVALSSSLLLVLVRVRVSLMMDTNGATPPVLLATTENGELHHDGAVGDGAGALRDARKSSWSSSFQPLCFSKDALNRPNFDVDLFIADCRRRVPLESVRVGDMFV